MKNIIYLFKETNLINIKSFVFEHGDWGLGIGDWGLGPIPKPQSPNPNPHSKTKLFILIKFVSFNK